MNKKLIEVFKLCVEISETTEHDVFFNYSPHINGFEVNCNIGGWYSDSDAVYLLDGYEQIEVNDTEKMEKVMVYLEELKEKKC